MLNINSNYNKKPAFSAKLNIEMPKAVDGTAPLLSKRECAKLNKLASEIGDEKSVINAKISNYYTSFISKEMNRWLPKEQRARIGFDVDFDGLIKGQKIKKHLKNDIPITQNNLPTAESVLNDFLSVLKIKFCGLFK